MSHDSQTKLPLIEHWGSYPLDLGDPMHRFKVSRWNYFLKDQASGVMGGYWEAEHGYEDLGRAADFDEVLHIISGRLYISCEGQEMIAESGDTVIVRRNRPMRVAAQERVRVFFICYPVEDIAGYEAAVRAGRHPDSIEKPS